MIGNISIGKLFLGGVIPGIAVGFALMIAAFATAAIGMHPQSSQKTSFEPSSVLWGDRQRLPLMTVVFVMGGIMAGLVTPTEAAIVAVFWALIVSGLVYRGLAAFGLKVVPWPTR